MDKEYYLEIKKKNTYVKVPRKELESVDEAYDGIVFKFIGGTHFYCMDVDMTNGTKQLIKNTIDRFPNGNIVVDLNKMKNPVSLKVE